MAATLVQSASNNSAGVASITVSSTNSWATPTSGNLLASWANSDTTITGPAGWTAGPSNVDGNGTYLWWKISAGTETTITFTPGGATSPVTVGALEYSGVSATPTDVQSFSTASAAGTSTTSVSVTGTGTSGDLFVAVAGLHSSPGGASAPTGVAWTNSFVNQQTVGAGTAGTSPYCHTFVADFQNTGAAAASTVASWTNNITDRQELLIAFKLAAGGAAAQIPTLVMARSA